jgi:3-methylcrotonyl-CoA carboxylase alpha subunit
MSMFHKILIANRGEIACRVIATARRLGIATVAVHSDADAAARHVAMADEAVRIGPAPVAESYLQGARIVAAAQRTGAQAIHPGYGFLSENPDFVETVEAAGLSFIGPPASAIRAMGLKDAAKALMQRSGVPVVPGYHGPDQDPGFLAAEAARIGYPVLIKARAGGGGKGMRLVERPAEFAAALDGARREAAASFGDPACLVEKYVDVPRHVEIQVFADGHGNAVHLFERDCSLQRRHQKVIEEAPAPGMPDDVRAAMGEAAVAAARAIDYSGAGTVEFIADGSQGLRPDGFWFMEMNTRLQVEHPVTEAITGLDLVELQLRVAAGEALPFAQDDLRIDGHAFEARIYAEDAARGFLPATGRLDYLALPAAAEFARAPVRIDSGVRQGDTITPYYDPMIAKLIVHGPNRAAALNRLAAALAEVHVAGTVTNLAFLGALARHEGFARGELDTGLIARDAAALTAEPEPPEAATALAALAALGLLEQRAGPDPWDRLAGWRHWSEARLFATLQRGGRRIERVVVAPGGGRYVVEGFAFTLERDDTGGLWITRDGHRARAHVAVLRDTVSVFMDGWTHAWEMPDHLREEVEADAGGDVLAAPMPGLVKLVAAGAGDAVEKGAALVVLEAMKMEHTLTAPRDGTVAEVLAQAGDQVVDGAVLLRLAPEDAPRGRPQGRPQGHRWLSASRFSR